MVTSLKDIFSKGNIDVQENYGNFNLELRYTINGIPKKCLIVLSKKELKEKKDELEDKINKLENKYNELFNKFEELRAAKEKDIRNIVKEVIFDNNIKIKLFREMAQYLLSKPNLNNDGGSDVEKEIINNAQHKINNKEDSIDKEIVNIQNQIKNNIEFLGDIKTNSYNNYIIFQIKINENDLNKDILLFNQVSTYKYFCNIEREDIEVIIDDKTVPIKFKNYMRDFKYDNKSKNWELSEKLEYNLTTKYSFYWNFATKGIHIIKIIFKKKLIQCNSLFGGCYNITKIDCSNFDCSQIIDCSQMFSYCYSLKEVNLWNLDFGLSCNFSGMFNGCQSLEILDVSNLNTENAKSLSYMFYGCIKLKEINVSNFNVSNCENIANMFYNCYSLESIDMLNWDMKNIIDMKKLFYYCSSLKSIKMNFNNNKIKLSKKLDIFYFLPESGLFAWKKGVDCKNLLELLPLSWNRIQV